MPNPLGLVEPLPSKYDQAPDLCRAIGAGVGDRRQECPLQVREVEFDTPVHQDREGVKTGHRPVRGHRCKMQESLA